MKDIDGSVINRIEPSGKKTGVFDGTVVMQDRVRCAVGSIHDRSIPTADKIVLAIQCDDDSATDKGNVILAEFFNTQLSPAIVLLRKGHKVRASFEKTSEGAVKITGLEVKPNQFAADYLRETAAKNHNE